MIVEEFLNGLSFFDQENIIGRPFISENFEALELGVFGDNLDNANLPGLYKLCLLHQSYCLGGDYAAMSDVTRAQLELRYTTLTPLGFDWVKHAYVTQGVEYEAVIIDYGKACVSLREIRSHLGQGYIVLR